MGRRREEFSLRVRRKIRGRNEALDVRVMALCVGDLYLDNIVRDVQNNVEYV